MSNKLKELRAKEGFTIIEVIIVLVIGAVIMLAVFLVVPQLQRTQRNTNRQNAARRVFTAAEQVNANTASYPAGSDTGKDAIVAITGTVNAASGSPVNWVYAIPTTGTIFPSDTLYYTNNNATCSTANVPAPSATATGKVVVAVATETASGTNSGWCVSN